VMGHDEANRWVDPLLERYPFRLSATSGAKQRAIVNPKPEPGEQPQYQITYSPVNLLDSVEEYVLISMIPGVDGRRKLLLLSGLNTQATLGAAEYLTSALCMRELIGEMRRRAANHTGPWRFQAILRTEVHDKVPT